LVERKKAAMERAETSPKIMQQQRAQLRTNRHFLTE
jgi:hypothetical protein